MSHHPTDDDYTGGPGYDPHANAAEYIASAYNDACNKISVKYGVTTDILTSLVNATPLVGNAVVAAGKMATLTTIKENMDTSGIYNPAYYVTTAWLVAVGEA